MLWALAVLVMLNPLASASLSVGGSAPVGAHANPVSAATTSTAPSGALPIAHFGPVAPDGHGFGLPTLADHKHLASPVVGSPNGGPTGQPAVRLPSSSATSVAPRAGATPESGTQSSARTAHPAFAFPISGWEGLTSNGDNSVPPDPQMAAGPFEVMEWVNVDGIIYSKNGTAIGGSFTLSSWFNTGTDTLTDPQLLYDNISGRWFGSISDQTTGQVVLGVSSTSHAGGAWYIYKLTGVPAGDWIDRPILGTGDSVVSVGGNDYSGSTWVGAQFWVIDRAPMLSNSGTYWNWWGPTAADESIHPVVAENLNYSGGNSQYFVSTTSGSGIQLYQVTGTPCAATCVTLYQHTLAYGPLTTPVDALQPGGNPPVSVALSTYQVMNAVWQDYSTLGGYLYLTFDEGCTLGGASVDCAYMVSILTASNALVENMDQGYSTSYNYYPEVVQDRYFDTVMIDGYSATSIYPSIWYAYQTSTATINGWSGAGVIASGNAPDVYPNCVGTASCRYGDYFGGGVDPTNPSLLWTVGEYVLTGLYWATFIQPMIVSSIVSPTVTPSPGATDVGQAISLSVGDTGTACASSQTDYCEISLPFGDGSSGFQACDGATNLWTFSHTYGLTGNYTAGGANGYVSEFGGTGGAACATSSFLGGSVLPEVPVRVHRDPVVAPPSPSATVLDVSQSVTFTTQMFGGTGSPTFTWTPSSSGLGCAASTTATITCSPTVAGSYSISVTATDAVSVTSVPGTSPTITVDTRPTVSIGLSATSLDVGQSLTATATAAGGSGSYTRYLWSASTPSLGCSGSGPSVTCTPVAAGSPDYVYVIVFDSNGASSLQGSSAAITVYGSVTTSTPTPSPASVDLGQPVTFSTIASGGSGSYPTYTWTQSSASLGCAVSTTASVTCTPVSPGTTYTVSVYVTDSNGGVSPVATSAAFTVYARPTISTPSANVTSSDVGQSVTFSTTVSGGSGGYTYTWSGLPTGCALATTASIVCSPSAAGTYSITVSATDSNGGSTGTSPPLSFTVYADPLVTTPTATPTTVEVGQPVSLSTTASLGSGVYTYHWSGLPTGCNVTVGDPLACTPGAAGSYAVVVTAIDSNKFPATSSPLSFKVINGPSVTVPTAAPTTVDVGRSVTFTTTASGGSGGYTYTWSGLPTPCLGANAATVTCSNPTTAGTFHVGLNLTDSSGGSAASGLLAFVVSALPTVSTPSATPASVDVGQTTAIAATVSGGAAPLTYVWSGLPTGCSGALATLSCTPSAAGTSSITLKVTDANGVSATSTALSFQVYALPSLSTPVATPNPVSVGTSLSIRTTLTGGAPSDTYAWSGLPTGCALANSATLTCNPTTAGSFSTSVSVRDGNGGTATSSSVPIVVSSVGGSLTVAALGSPSSGTAPLTVAFNATTTGGGPGLAFLWLFGDGQTATTRNPSHTYTTAGTFVARVYVNDTSSGTATGTVTTTVSPASGGSPTVSLSANPSSVTVGSTSTLTGSVSGGTSPYTYSWTGLPPGCSSTNGATLTCAPTGTGTFTVSLTVTDSKGNTGQGSATLTVTKASGTPNNNQSSNGNNGILGNPLLLVAIAVVVVAAVAAALLLRRRRPSAPASSPPPPPEAAAPATPPAEASAAPPPAPAGAPPPLPPPPPPA